MASLGLVAATENYVNGEKSFTRGFLKETFAGIAESQKDAGQEAGWYSIYKMGEMLAEFIETFIGKNEFSDMARSWGQRGMNDGKDPQPPAEEDSFSHETHRADQNGDIAAVATTAVLGRTAIQVGAHAGIRAVPVLGSVFTAASGLWDAAGYAYEGDFTKAGVRIVSGAVESVGMLGGFTTAAAGIVGREAVEEIAAKLLGEDAHLPDSPLYGAGKSAVNWALTR